MPKSNEFMKETKRIQKVVGELVIACMNIGIKKAIKYIAKDIVAKATYRGPRIKAYQHTVLLTLGKPNYAERKFIKDLVKAGESFPVKKIQLKLEKKNGHKTNAVRRSSRRRKNK